MGKRNRLPGHFCWVCGRRRPNERFSGKGHSAHVCRDCARLGPEELAYRQTARNMERCVTFDGFIPRKQRAVFERFLQHEDPRIRALAQHLERMDAHHREQSRAEREAYDLDCEVSPSLADVDAVNEEDIPF